MKRSHNLIWTLISLLVVASMLLTACGDGEEATNTPEPEPTEAPEPTKAPEVEPPTEEFRVGMISDVGGVDDASFNQTTWEGLDRADKEIEGVAAQFLESQAQADYENNITEFAEQGYDMIVTVGFLLGDATAKMAEVYPDIKFAIIDFAYDPAIPNVQGIVFNSDEAAFLAGYLAAGMAVELDPDDPQIGWVGGMQIPPVEIFIVGYESGMAYYNAQKGTDVTAAGTYVGDFEAPDEGKTAGNSLLDEGVDIIFGVGGKTGNGGLVAVRERAEAGEAVAGIGVDVDQYFTLPTEKGILVTSVEKRLDNAVYNSIQAAVEGKFGGGGVYVGMLANDGVGLAPYHDWENRVPADLKAEVDALKPQVISGEISTGWPVVEAEEPELPFAGQELVIGLMTDKSGALAIYGPSQTQGFYLGLEYATNGTMEVAGRPIRVIEKDNGSDPETGVSQARELIEAEGAEVLIGNISSGVALAVMPVVEENDVIFIAEPAAAPQITADNFSPNTFRTSRTSFQDALVMGVGLLDMGETFVQIAPDYAFGIGSACSFYPVVKAGGGEFVVNDTAEGCGTIFAPLDTTDFTPYINQILDTGADVLIVTWAGAGFAPMFQQMGQLGVFDEMVIGTGIGDNQTLAAGYADALQSVGVHVYHYTYPDNAINDWLVERHIEEYGTPPDLWAAGGMMAAIMAVEGVTATNGDASAATLIAVYEDNFEFDGPKGAVMIRPYDHVALQTLYFARLDNVTDPDLKFVELIKAFSPEETAPPCQLPEAYADRCP